MNTTLSDLQRSGVKIRCRLGRARTPLESDSLIQAAAAAVALARVARGWGW